MMSKLCGGLTGLLMLSMAFAAENGSSAIGGLLALMLVAFTLIIGMLPVLFVFGLWLLAICSFIALAIFWIMMIIDLAQAPENSFEGKDGKMMWLLIVLLLGPIGGIAYYFAIKSKRPAQKGKRAA